MPNQMIALQARNPQITDPSRQTAQFANMMNMARQAEAAQLQGQRIRQEMEYARAGEGRAAETQKASMRKSDLDYQIDDMKRLRNIGVAVLQTKDPITREAAYQNWLGMVSKSDPQFGDTLRQVAGNFDADIMQTVLMEADKFIDKTIATPTASLEVSTSGEPRSVTVGGLRPGQQGVYDIPETTTATPRATPTAPQAAAPASVGEFGEAKFVNPESIPLTPYQQEHIREMQNGLGMSQPASFTRGAGAVQMTPEVAQQIVDTAVKTGMMAQADFDQLMALAPEQNKQPFMDMLKANNIALQPGGAGQQSQFAVYRGQPMQSQTAGLRGAPPMEQTLAQMRTSTPLQQRNPNVSPAPSPVAPAILGAQEGAKTSASKNVELQMNPRIAADIKKAERDVEKRAEAPKALSAAKSVVNGLDDYIETIDRLLRSPDRHTIVGRFEGRIPYALQDERQAELQADFDKIKNTDTLTSLVEMKQASPTGGSPVGNASNQDVLLVARGANSLVQTGGVPKFDQELKNIRRQAYRARQTAIEEYNNRYGDLAAGDPRLKLTVRPTADRYISTKDLPQNKSSASGHKTSVIPDGAKQMLRKNPSPQQRAFFDRTFGAGAAAKVLGTR